MKDRMLVCVGGASSGQRVPAKAQRGTHSVHSRLSSPADLAAVPNGKGLNMMLAAGLWVHNNI